MHTSTPDNHSNNNGLFVTLVYRPLKLIFRHWGVLVVSATVIALDRYLNFSQNLMATADLGTWLFVILPEYAWNAIHSTPIIPLLIASLILKGLFITYFANDLALQFKNTRVNAVNSIITLPIWSITRFLLLQLCIYVLFGSIAISIYLLAKNLWTQGYRSSVAFLMVGFFVFYPLFYAALSISSLLSILPVKFKRYLVKYKIFMQPANFAKTYLFYLLRSIVDYACLFIIPTLILFITHNWFVSMILMSISLSLPIAFVRTSSFAFKLQVLSEDNDVANEFRRYFQTLGQVDALSKTSPISS